jgi:Flp pilus assembly protein TadG
MVEFTLMIGLLLIVVFAIIDFGAALYDQTMLASAATDGARSGAISNSTSAAQSTARAAVNNPIGCHRPPAPPRLRARLRRFR